MDRRISSLPGVMAYGATEAEARDRTAALALRAIADRIEHGEAIPPEARKLFAFARALACREAGKVLRAG